MMAGGNDVPRYDRDFLLSPAKRNQIIKLWEVEKFGRDSFGDPNAVSFMHDTSPVVCTRHPHPSG